MFELQNLKAHLAATEANRAAVAHQAKTVPIEEWAYNLEVLVVMYDFHIKDLKERIDELERT